MRDPVTGNPHTAHTTNPVPFLMVGDGLEFKPSKKVVEEHAEVKEAAREKEGLSEAEKKEDEEHEEDEPAICDVAPTVLDIMVCVFGSTSWCWDIV